MKSTWQGGRSLIYFLNSMESMMKTCGSCDTLNREMKKTASTANEEEFNGGKVYQEPDLIKCTEAHEMGEVREENQRLKMILQQVEKDYKSLQLRHFDILKQEAPKSDLESTPSSDENEETDQLVSLCLGRTSREVKKRKKHRNSANTTSKEYHENIESSLTLGLPSSFPLPNELASDPSCADSSEELKDVEVSEKWQINKSLERKRDGEDESCPQVPAKRARVSVRARCDAPTMNDGCQWRKYGQKISKGNPCPRAYYRCTVAPECPVRKQVQRCAEDMSILITTYEGTHSHPLPVSATAMASTTSAAASMLLSGSSASQSGHNSTGLGHSATVFNSLNFNNLCDYSKTKHSYMSTTPSNLFPTITLDLTSPLLPTTSPQFNRLYPLFGSSSRFPPTSLSFSKSEFNTTTSLWGNGTFGSVAAMPPFDKTLMGSISPGNQANSQEALAETLTKAITTDPVLRSVVASAISSIAGRSNQHEQKRRDFRC